jgi:hypothetical protein
VNDHAEALPPLDERPSDHAESLRGAGAYQNLNLRDARTYNPAPTLWKYDPRTNILWLKLTDASQHLVVPDPPLPIPAVSRLHRRSLIMPACIT